MVIINDVKPNNSYFVAGESADQLDFTMSINSPDLGDFFSQHDGDLFWHVDPDFDIINYEHSAYRLFYEYIRDLQFLVTEYGLADDNILSDSAKELKKKVNETIDYEVVEGKSKQSPYLIKLLTKLIG